MTVVLAMQAMRAELARQQHVLAGVRNESIAADTIDTIDRLEIAIKDLAELPTATSYVIVR